MVRFIIFHFVLLQPIQNISNQQTEPDILVLLTYMLKLGIVFAISGSFSQIAR